MTNPYRKILDDAEQRRKDEAVWGFCLVKRTWDDEWNEWVEERVDPALLRERGSDGGC